MNFLKRVFLGILFNGLALYGIVKIIEGVSYSGGFKLFFISGIILGLLNTLIKPLLKLVTLPLVFLSGGLFIIVINAILLRLLVYVLDVIKFSDVTLKFDTFGIYLLSALVFGIINWFIHLIVKNK
jgi:putative membrane protein